MVKTKTDCRTEVGIAVGLIDTMINSARILRKMMDDSLHKELYTRKKNLESTKAVKEALKDLFFDADIIHINNCAQELSKKSIKSEVKFLYPTKKKKNVR